MRRTHLRIQQIVKLTEYSLRLATATMIKTPKIAQEDAEKDGGTIIVLELSCMDTTEEEIGGSKSFGASKPGLGGYR